jgi:hypothetical protein
MKNFNYKKAITVFSWCLLLNITGCKKQEIPGPQGEPGTPGGGGNSSITSSSVVIVENAQWKWDAVSNSQTVTVDAPLITKDVIDKGAVKVYVQKASSWSELPFVNGDLFTQFAFDEGHVHLSYLNIEGGSAPVPATQNFRIVVLSESP